MRSKFCLCLIVGLSFVLRGVPLMGSATDFWITQNGAGSANGTSLANAAACDATANTAQSTCAAFNSSTNWGAGSGQIGAGTTVHVTGTITAAANACNYFSFRAGGSSGSPITFLMDPTTLITAPTWGSGCGAIYSSGYSYITINGGATGSAVAGCTTSGCTGFTTVGGVIQATANGTGLTYQVLGNGIILYSCSNCTVENTTISNIYVHACTLPVTNCTDENGDPTGAVYADGGSNLLITNNVVHDMKWALEHNFANGNTNITFSNNQVYHADHGEVEAPAAGSSDVMGSVYVYGNVYHDPQNWDDAGNNNHHDGVHMWSPGTGVEIQNAYVYNNFEFGNFGVGFNCGFYFENQPTGSLLYIFNNIIDETGTSGHAGNGYIGPNANTSGGATVLVANNTVYGPNTSIGTGINTNGEEPISIYNNLLSNMSEVVYIVSVPAAIDYQDYYNVGSGAWTGGASLAAWVTYCLADYVGAIGCDAHSTTGNPNLNAAFEPQSGSAVIKAGTNLYGTCNNQPNPGLGALCYDAAGLPRPSTGGWDIGAYNFVGGASGLTATPH